MKVSEVAGATGIWPRLQHCGTRRWLHVGVGVCMVAASTFLTRIEARGAGPIDDARAIAAAEAFMRRVASLSPRVFADDPDRSQAWPRALSRYAPDPTGKGLKRYDRSQAVSVRTDASPADPGVGRRSTVGLCGGVIQVGVSEQADAIGLFVDGVLSERLATDPPPTRTIEREVAVARAGRYLAAAGIDLTDMVLETAYMTDRSEPPTGESCRWSVTWRRVWKGVPYQDQWATAQLDAGLGRLMMLGSRLAAQAPTSERIEVSRERSESAVRAFLSDRGLTPAGEPSASLRVVLPTNYWANDSRRSESIGDQSRLAWVVRTDIAAAPPTLRTAEVWIDAATGAVVGGDEGVAMAGARVRTERRSVAAIGRAVSLELRPVPGGPSRVRGEQDDPLAFYGAVGSIRPRRADASGGSAPFRQTDRLVAIGWDRARRGFAYDRGAGLIRGSDGVVWEAGPLLRSLLAQKSSLAKRP